MVSKVDSSPPGLTERSSAGGSCVLRCALAVYLAALAAFVVWSANVGLREQSFEWFAAENVLSRVVGRAVMLLLLDVVLFLPLAFLVAANLAGPSRRSSCLGSICLLGLGLVCAFGVSMAARTVLNGLPIRRPAFPETVLLAGLTIAGSWAGTTWCFARSFLGWAAGQLLLLLAASGCLLGLLYGFALDAQPMSFDPAAVSSEDRRRLVKLFHHHDPRDLEPGATKVLTLTESDLDQLLAWGLSLVPGEQKCRVNLSPSVAWLRFSAAIPGSGRYLNISAAGAAFVDDGKLAVKPRRLRIGQLAIPRWVLVAAGPSTFDRAVQNRHTRPYLSSLKNVDLAAGQASVTYGHLEISGATLRHTLEALGQPADRAPAVAVYAQQLISLSNERRKLLFEDCLGAVFATARERSAAGHDPILENRSAILALGYLLGDDSLAVFAGSGLPQPASDRRWKFRGLTIHGRRDWARHFAFSGGLEVGSTSTTARMFGLLKEELDADGGSGFSFGDLLSDRAGAKFAHFATKGPDTARAVQDHLAGEWTVQDFFPAAADLPEGLSDAEFQRQYGGVGGTGYQELLSEIERRIGACALYRG